MSERVDIIRLGHAGDGVAADGTFVPFTVPGDVVRIERDGTRGRLIEVIKAGPARVAPVSPHFGICGGCALQHVARDACLAWKQQLVVDALAQRGFADLRVDPIIAVPPGTRRRATFKARRTRDGVVVGFYERDSHAIVDLRECPLLVPRLEKLLAALREGIAPLMREGETAEIHATAIGNALDLALRWKRASNADLLMDLASLAREWDAVRLTWNGELVAQTETPTLRMGRYNVPLPPEAFLQPTDEGERVLQSLVIKGVNGARNVADLFSGIGTFALVLAEGRAVHAVESDAAMTKALSAARAPRVTVETRDLFRRPLLANELAKFDAVVIDPPRPGAGAQAKALAASRVPRIIYVSCNPASFARDARTLADGDYKLVRVQPIDQFVWSAHTELIGVFER